VAEYLGEDGISQTKPLKCYPIRIK